MRLIIGLGNPGPRYETTRHNAGFLVLDELARRYGIGWSGQKFKGVFGSGTILGNRCLLLKPLTFMNLSGRSVQQAKSFYKLSCESLIVLHDDVDVPEGVVKAKVGGGDGGHNGIKSIKQETGCQNFHRLKLGVGRPEGRGDVSDWVLGALAEDTLAKLTTDMCDALVVRLKNIL